MAGSGDAAWAVVFEPTAHQMHAIGQQGGGEGIARIPLIGFAVEGKAERRATINAATLRQAELLAHDWIFASGESEGLVINP